VLKLERTEAVTGTPSLLGPLSDEWFAFWSDRFERLVAGESPARIGRIPLEVIDAMRTYDRAQAGNGGAESWQ
jgi:hypothetical protein